MKIYIARSDGALCSYDGQSLETIQSLLADIGLTGKVISQTDYHTQIESKNKAAQVIPKI